MSDWTPLLDRSSQPRYLEICDRIAADVASGALLPGDRLPPQRRLAERLGIDFTTVSRAYAHARDKGLVVSHVGRGTFVARPDRTAHAQASATQRRRAEPADLTMNLPPDPTDPDLIARMQDGLTSVSANLVHLLRYQTPTGGPVDREAASAWLSMRGLVPPLERIAITPGAHPAMTAILSQLCQPGDAVLCEQITYPGLRAIAALLRLEVVGVPGDADGMDPDALDAAIRARRPKALYLNPTLQNPTTLTIPPARREALADVARQRRLPIIEDDAYGFVQSHAPTPLATLAPEQTWHIGGLAKCIGAGLRLAFVVAPDRRQALSLAQALKTLSVMASPLTMALVTRWIEDGTADRIRRFIRAEARARQSIAGAALEKFDVASAPEAFNIWLRLPPGWRRADLIGRMAGDGPPIMPSDPFTVGDDPPECVRICLCGSTSRETLRDRLDLLAHTLDYGLWAT